MTTLFPCHVKYILIYIKKIPAITVIVEQMKRADVFWQVMRQSWPDVAIVISVECTTYQHYPVEIHALHKYIVRTVHYTEAT